MTWYFVCVNHNLLNMCKLSEVQVEMNLNRTSDDLIVFHVQGLVWS